MSEQLELLTESPSQWTSVSYVTPEIHKKEIKPFVILAIKELEGTPDSRTASLLNADKFAAVRAVVRHLSRLRSSSGGPWRPVDVTTFLEGLKFSPECTAEFSQLLCTEQLYESVPAHFRTKPALVSLQWKIDLSLCQANIDSELSKQQMKEVLHRDARVIISIHLSDGSRRTLRLTVAMFHEFRYTIASALKSAIVLERRKCMKKD